MSLSLSSTVRLSSGYTMPLLGFGVYQMPDALPHVVEAFKAVLSCAPMLWIGSSRSYPITQRHVDTAQMYKNEDQVGQALRQSGLARNEVFITTKINSRSHGYDNTVRGVDDSLRRLGFDYIDLFLIHDAYSGKEKRLETYKALLEAKAAGKVRSVGVSNYGVKHLEEIAAAGYEIPAVNQIELHPFCQQRPIVEYCQAHSIVIEAYCPVIRGKLDHPIFLRLAEKYKLDPAQVVLRWSLQKGFVPLPKSATTSRIHSNAQLYDFELTTGEVAEIDALDCGKEGAVSWNPVDAE